MTRISYCEDDRVRQVCESARLVLQEGMHVVLFEVQLGVQLDHFERQRQQPLCLQFGEDLEQRFGDGPAGWQIPPVADLEGHMDEGVIVFAVCHAPGVQAHSATANPTQGKYAAVSQDGVYLFE